MTLLSESNHSIKQTLFIASDHAGLEMKRHLIGRFPFLKWKDLGTNSETSVDYPDFAGKLCLELEPHLKNEPRDAVGILICGSGQGMCIAANRYPFIRAALCWNDEIAKLSRQHNDANVLCLAGRQTSTALAEQIFTTFLNTEFEGGRHKARLAKLKE